MSIKEVKDLEFINSMVSETMNVLDGESCTTIELKLEYMSDLRIYSYLDYQIPEGFSFFKNFLNSRNCVEKLYFNNEEILVFNAIFNYEARSAAVEWDKNIVKIIVSENNQNDILIAA